MRFMMIMFPPKRAETGVMPEDTKIFEEMNRYNEELQKAGVLLALDGLQPTSKGARLVLDNGKKKLVDGPFTESKEIVGGYWMIQVRSRDEALAWLQKVPLEPGSFVELRQVFELSDFPEAMQKIAEPLAKTRAEK